MPPNDPIYSKVRACVGITLESNEELHLVIRKHWIRLVETSIFIAILCIVSIGAYIIGSFAGIPTIFLLVTMVGIIMVSAQFIFVHWVNNELDLLIITNRRIISYDQIGFLDRKMSQTTIDLVQEVNASTSGLLGNLLHYGNMVIRTSSDTIDNIGDFNMSHIPNPIETSRSLHSFIDEYRHSLNDSGKK